MKSTDMDDAKNKETIKKPHFSFRVNLFFFCTFLLFSILIVRLAILQFVEGERLGLEELDTSEYSYKIEPIRGEIYDRNGYRIAYSIPRQSLFYRIEPDQKPGNVIKLAQELEEIFKLYGTKDAPKLTAEEIILRMDVGYDLNGFETKPPSYYSIPRRIKEGLSKEEIAYIMGHYDVLHGLEVSEESLRHYDSDHIAVQLVGYLRPFNTVQNNNVSYLRFYQDKGMEYLTDEYIGLDGIEFMFQDELRGKTGWKTYQVNASQKIVGNMKITKPEKGKNIYLTIDKNVQLAAEKAIEDHLAFMKSDEAKGTQYYKGGHKAAAGYAVAMEVKTGRVVAMASIPDYDPNVWQDGLLDAELELIKYRYANGTIKERYADLPDWGSHPSSLVPPGSSIKPLTVLVGLNEGIITPGTPYRDKGVFYFGKDDSKVYNSDGHQYGNLTAATAIQHSSNTFMSEMIGNALYMSGKYDDPLKVWDDYMKKFGLGSSTKSGLPGEYNGDIYYIKNKNETGQSKLVYASFGQQARYTTLQLAQYAATLASHGQRLKPQFVDKITTTDGEVVRTFEKEVLNEEHYPQEYWDTIEKGMSKVFVNGFDDFAYYPDNLARKTGTSEQQVAGNTVDNAVFIAYAPLNNPTLAIAVVVPEGGFGSWGAAPIARQIFDAYNKYIGLEEPVEK